MTMWLELKLYILQQPFGWFKHIVQFCLTFELQYTLHTQKAPWLMLYTFCKWFLCWGNIY